MVQEYERAVIFRLGRLRKGGAKVILPHTQQPGCGSGFGRIHFILPDPDLEEKMISMYPDPESSFKKFKEREKFIQN